MILKKLKRFSPKRWSPRLSWALYDWANSAFATTVMAGFFPIMLKQYWSSAETAQQSTFFLGAGNSLASLSLAFFAPMLGLLADQGGRRKKYLAICILLGISGTSALAFTTQHLWSLALLFYLIATIGFTAGNIFYDALIVEVSEPNDYDHLSALGYSLGYLGGGLLFAVQVLFVLNPHWLGASHKLTVIDLSFISVAFWWLLFSVPLFFNVTESSVTQVLNKSTSSKIRQYYQAYVKLLKKAFSDVTLRWFLIAYLFYIDAINTIIKMAVDFGLALGLSSDALITALLITQFIGFPAAIVFGYIGSKYGSLKGIYLAITIYLLVTFFAMFITSEFEFYLMAASIGLVQGGIQALSRSHFARLLPDKTKSAEYFGIFNMAGKFSAILGPVLVGFISWSTGNSRFSLIVIVVFLLIGAALLKVHEKFDVKL